MMELKTEDAGESQMFGPAGETILIIANMDLFSECLAEAIANRFAGCKVVSTRYSKAMPKRDVKDVKVVLFQHAADVELNGALQFVRENCPSTSIGLVVEAMNVLEPNIKRLIEARVIDGVLPLNLRLDVFMEAVDLLIKGGEHVPSTLLNRLTAAQPEKSPYETKSVSAASAGAPGLRQGDLSALTAREVQILDLICKGSQNKLIAHELHLSENTVKVHVRNIYQKMDVRNRTEAASRFFSAKPATRAAGGETGKP